MRTGNPAFSSKSFDDFECEEIDESKRVTIQGTVNKTGILLLLVVISSLGGIWYLNYCGNISTVHGLCFVGGIGGLIVGVATIFKNSLAPVSAPIYALFEGLFIGGMSLKFESIYPGLLFRQCCLLSVRFFRS